MVDPLRNVTPRLPALLALLFFFPVVVSFAVARGAFWVDYPGILFHLAMFLLVAKLDAPDWAKAAGYVWLALDVTTGVMTLNHVPRDIANYVRFGGHIFAGTWLFTSSLSGWLPMKIVGVITGAWMFLFSFLTPFVPLVALAPSSPLILVWLALIVWKDGNGRQGAWSRSDGRPGPLVGGEQLT